MRALIRVTASFNEGETLEQRMTRLGGFTTGFDYLRIGLAVLVLTWHSIGSSYGPDFVRALLEGPLHGVVSAILSMFFALSGFLVCGSLFRTKSFLAFATHRVLRLVPALAVEIMLSALLLGPVMTTLPLSEYFSGAEFRSYFLNIIGVVHFQLPGIFLDTPQTRTVNSSLWTVPYELECYLALFILFTIGWLRRPRLLISLVLMSWIVSTLPVLWNDTAGTLMQATSPGRQLVVCFLAGNIVYLVRDRIHFNARLFLVSALASLALLSRPELTFLAPLPVAYMTVWLGLLTPRKIPFLMDGDYSYGIYLFAYPIQQTYSAIFIHAHHWWANASVAFVFSLAYAFFSWHLIEKPVLTHRKRVVWTLEHVQRQLFRRSLDRAESRVGPPL